MSVKWTKPKYPGDAVRIVMLIRDNEIGDVRIQDYGTRARVGSFLPGHYIVLPGDTPKTEPERSEWFKGNERGKANKLFDEYVIEARRDGWKHYTP